MDIGDRKKEILAAIVECYIETAEPVGSKSIARNSSLGLSPATIRNEMAELTAMGYLEQPHTSSGRIPSPQGYRIYVNDLMRQHRLSIQETEEINRSLHQKVQQFEALLADVGRVVAELTNYPTYTLAAKNNATVSRFDLIFVDANTFIIVVMLDDNTVKNKLIQLPFPVEEPFLKKLGTVFNAGFTHITEDAITSELLSSAERACGDTMGLVAVIAGFTLEVLTQPQQTQVAGSNHILEHPEYKDINKARRFLGYLSNDPDFFKLPLPEGDKPKILIGPENVVEELQDSSVVMARYDLGDNYHGLIGVVGPTRMDYGRVAAQLSYIAQELGNLIRGSPATQKLITNRRNDYVRQKEQEQG